ncbi:hypothetical protein C8Q76DRAFT_792813 [Earliella scabrosa]|nr:hypothetical protein C8Q76DRAFT_792813 [Earliella scabrosa]
MSGPQIAQDETHFSEPVRLSQREDALQAAFSADVQYCACDLTNDHLRRGEDNTRASDDCGTCTRVRQLDGPHAAPIEPRELTATPSAADKSTDSEALSASSSSRWRCRVVIDHSGLAAGLAIPLVSSAAVLASIGRRLSSRQPVLLVLSVSRFDGVALSRLSLLSDSLVLGQAARVWICAR